MKILAVDDDPFILELLTIMSTRLGFADIITVPSGEAALETLRDTASTFDCFLLDISMPGMDGIELCSRIRSLSAYRTTPIIMLTAMTDTDYVERAFKAGATDYANKPFDIVELGARLRIAQELVMARASTKPKDDAQPGSDTPNPIGTHQFELSDEIAFEDIDSLVELTALGNYLIQLSRDAAIASQVIAVKVEDIEAIYDQTSSDQFIGALEHVIKSIGSVFDSYGYLMGYTGNGIFIIISHKVKLEPSISLEHKIQALLEENALPLENGVSFPIEVSLGNPIRPSTNKTQPVRKTFERAISRAENRAAKKRAEVVAPKKRIIG
ncbi:response regulator [Oceaniglobus ichthyenteri]|uniref:response regulator n=1 Tax=Oceaniglobus ichthyenteri TaxID=2136177 RepID=UPI000D38D835|nr:response regulator [Oceaniglobus ichthyenteri]